MIPLARKIDRYRRNECRRSNNRLTPGRCKAATKYANQANKFIKQSDFCKFKVRLKLIQVM